VPMGERQLQDSIISTNVTVWNCSTPVDVTVGLFSHGALSSESGRLTLELHSPFGEREIPAARRSPGPPYAPDPLSGDPISVPASHVLRSFVRARQESFVRGNIPRQGFTSKPVVADFEADWLSPRDRTSCYLLLPYFDLAASSGGLTQKSVAGDKRQLVVSWTRVYTYGVGIAPDPAAPVSVTSGGAGTFRCTRARFPDKCAARAILQKPDAQDRHDLVLLMLGVFLSVGAAALLEGATGWLHGGTHQASAE
jgi:hypothetical protein